MASVQQTHFYQYVSETNGTIIGIISWLHSGGSVNSETSDLVISSRKSITALRGHQII